MSRMKSIVVTGASRGIGRDLSEFLIKKNYFVFGCSRGKSDLTHSNYRHFCVDVTNESQVTKMFGEISKDESQLYGLVNSAGIASMNHTFLTPSSTVDRVFSVNFKGTFNCSKGAAKLMKNFKNGRIVNFSTIAVPICLEGEAIYAASKSAVETFSKTFAKEISRYNITVNVLGPNPVKTDLIKGVENKKINNVIDMQIVKRFGSFEDIRNVVDFYLKEESSMITGQKIYLGGLS